MKHVNNGENPENFLMQRDKIIKCIPNKWIVLLALSENVWSQICDWLRKFGRNFKNFSRKINWGHLINK